MLTVPLLIAANVPVLESLAAAQVPSIVIAGVGTVGYLASGSVDWPMGALVGVPELAGVLIGWKIAHALPTRKLKYSLVIALFALASISRPAWVTPCSCRRVDRWRCVTRPRIKTPSSSAG